VGGLGVELKLSWYYVSMLGSGYEEGGNFSLLYGPLMESMQYHFQGSV
jgi:hypothetical protein